MPHGRLRTDWLISVFGLLQLDHELGYGTHGGETGAGETGAGETGAGETGAGETGATTGLTGAGGGAKGVTELETEEDFDVTPFGLSALITKL